MQQSSLLLLLGEFNNLPLLPYPAATHKVPFCLCPAAAAHLPASKALREAWAAGRQPTWYRRQLAYSWDILVENLSDPCESL